jgi:hypothetical protein
MTRSMKNNDVFVWRLYYVGKTALFRIIWNLMSLILHFIIDFIYTEIFQNKFRYQLRTVIIWLAVDAVCLGVMTNCSVSCLHNMRHKVTGSFRRWRENNIITDRTEILSWQSVNCGHLAQYKVRRRTPTNEVMKVDEFYAICIDVRFSKMSLIWGYEGLLQKK